MRVKRSVNATDSTRIDGYFDTTRVKNIDSVVIFANAV